MEDLCFTGDRDLYVYQLAKIDGMYILLAELSFVEAWSSLQEIMWVGNNSYRVLDVLNDEDNYSDFYTTIFERN